MTERQLRLTGPLAIIGLSRRPKQRTAAARDQRDKLRSWS